MSVDDIVSIYLDRVANLALDNDQIIVLNVIMHTYASLDHERHA